MVLSDPPKLSCRKAGLLISPYLADDPDLSAEQREAFEAHLAACPRCAHEYELSTEVVDFLQNHWTTSPDTLELMERAGLRPKGCRSAPGHEQWSAEGRPQVAVRPWFARPSRIAAVAASIALLLGVAWLAVSRPGPPADRSNGTQGRAVAQGAAAAEFTVERITATGREALPLDEPITTGREPQELLLGGVHRVVMNADSTVTIGSRAAALASGGTSGGGGAGAPTSVGTSGVYLVLLAEGELYVEVVPGHAFEVTTPNARVAVTGTRFNVIADEQLTNLALLKGSVRFSGLGDDRRTVGAVDVAAGYASTVRGRAGPTAPHKVDALAVTAWARDLSTRNAVASLATEDIALDLGDDWWQPSQPDPSTLDYETWRDEHQDWFATQFPWIFQVQAALAEQHGIEADYIHLLMISGDIWQFHYPPSPRKLPRPRKLPGQAPPWEFDYPLTSFDPAAVERLARHYQVDAAELLAAVDPHTRADSDTPSSAGATWPAALSRWRQDILAAAEPNAPAMDTDLILFSMRAGAHLANTRTAAYLWVTAYPAEAQRLLTDEDYFADYLAPLVPNDVSTAAAWTAELAEHVAAAQSSVGASQELLTAPAPDGCASLAATVANRLATDVAVLLAEGDDSPHSGVHAR